MPFFTVIIPTYNRAEMLREAIETVLQQTYKDYEIIVIDDGSTDNTSNIASEYINQIQYHKHDNSGVAYSRNIGIELAQGDYICYLDSDDLWDSSKLEKYKSVIDDNPDASFIFSDFRKHNIQLPEPYNQTNTDIFSYIFDFFTPKEKNVYMSTGIPLVSLIMRGYPFYPSTFAIKKQAHAHFRWDPNVLKSEDFNFILKLSSRYPFLYIHQCLSTIRVHDSNKSADYLTKNRVNLMTMIMFRDLYSDSNTRSLYNHYISQKLFLDGTSYISKGHYRQGIRNIASSLTYKENWKRLIKNRLPITRKP